MTYDLATPSAARLWNYLPDWSRGYDVRRSFRTDIIRSRNNTEQRRSLRDVPRLSIDYSANVRSPDLIEAKHELRFAQNQPRTVLDYSRYTVSTTLLSGGLSSFEVAAVPSWIAAGQLIAFCGGGVVEVVQVDSVAVNVITLTAPVSNTWPLGSVIRPALFGLLAGQISASRVSDGVQNFSLRFDAYPGGEPPEDLGTADTLFQGLEVFTGEVDFGSAPSVDYQWPVEQVDYGIGRTAQFRPVVQHEQLIEGNFTGRSRAEVAALEAFWLRHKGRRTAFYRPTCQNDMQLAANANGSSIDVEGTLLAQLFANADSPFTDLALEIVLTSGTRLRRLITGITTAGANSRISLNASTTATVAGTARISWMPLCRFGSDELVTRWQSQTTATVPLSFQSLRLPA